MAQKEDPLMAEVNRIPFPQRTKEKIEELALQHTSLTRQANDIEAAINLIVDAVMDAFDLSDQEWEFVSLDEGFARRPTPAVLPVPSGTDTP